MEAVWQGFPSWLTWISATGIDFSTGGVGGAFFSYVQLVAREVRGVYVVQESDLNGVSHTRPKRWSGTRRALNLRPDVTRVIHIVAGDKTHLSTLDHRLRGFRPCNVSIVGPLFIENF